MKKVIQKVEVVVVMYVLLHIRGVNMVIMVIMGITQVVKVMVITQAENNGAKLIVNFVRSGINGPRPRKRLGPVTTLVTVGRDKHQLRMSNHRNVVKVVVGVHIPQTDYLERIRR